MKASLIALIVGLSFGLFLVQHSFAAGCESCQAKTVSGAVNCAGCSGITPKCALMITDKDGKRWVLTGDSDTYKAAFNARHSKKTITATLAGAPETKKGKDGKEYLEVKVSDVKISES